MTRDQMYRVPVRALALLLGLTLGMCGSAQLALAQAPQPVTQVYLSSARSTWSTSNTHVCVMGVARAGQALVVGYSIAMDCANRIGVAEMKANRQCEERVGCARLWRVQFDVVGVQNIWIREREPAPYLETR